METLHDEDQEMSNPDKERTADRCLKGMWRQKTRQENERLRDEKRKKAGFEEATRRSKKRPRRDGGDLTRPDVAGETVSSLATVLAVHKGRVEIQNEGEVIAARLDKRLAVSTTAIAVGDEVEVAMRAEHCFVLEVLPRRTAIRRSDPHRPERERVIAANIDVAVIVVTGKHPPFKPGLVDRWLVVTRSGGVRPVLCVNKIDLLDTEDERQELDRRLRVYRDLDVCCLSTSALSLEGVDRLGNEIAGSTCVFIGHSGVGKSTLLNALDPEGSDRSTGEVREIDGRGRHTTSSSSLVVRPDGTRVIDTPGVRSVGLFRVDDRQLRCAFPELDLAAALCRFKSCRHLDELDCRVREDVAEGVISRTRYDAYVRILRSLEEES